MAERVCTCSREEREVLNMVRHWPGIPAIVTYYPDGRWSVSTAQEDIDRRDSLVRDGVIIVDPRG